MSKVTQGVRCGSCFEPLAEPADLLSAERRPCPKCGSTQRNFQVFIEGSISIKTQVSVKQKRPGYKRPVFEGKSGDDLHRDTGTWRKLVRAIDRLRNRYFERITDPEAGHVFREVHEPLTEHFDRGAATRRDDSPSSVPETTDADSEELPQGHPESHPLSRRTTR